MDTTAREVRENLGSIPLQALLIHCYSFPGAESGFYGGSLVELEGFSEVFRRVVELKGLGVVDCCFSLSRSLF